MRVSSFFLCVVLSCSAVQAFMPATKLSPVVTRTQHRSLHPAVAPSRTQLRSYLDNLSPPPPVEKSSFPKHAVSLAFEYAVITSLLKGFFTYVLPKYVPTSLRTPITFLTYAFLSLKSRTFSLCNNSRPEKREKGQLGWYDRTMPKWTPPGIFFPIMWVLIITPLRAYSSTCIHSSAATPAAALATTRWLILHLCVGDVWNTINNVEGRLGVSALTVIAVLGSALNAGRNYFAVSKPAGYMLSATCGWLSIATVLIWNTWWINKRDGKRDTLLPKKDGRRTQFVFEK
ncbi:hypothetical protein TrST_g13516 [Triparma strigata]|uniref:Uncharacterized protein n=1 Tax=Triparma strigata TaxID=1606541 RepID=A0A9W7ACF3_9STRA|nr:hypothetical protein TrST_g13516 [Triparma strigata]